jgi:hypothetical protein
MARLFSKKSARCPKGVIPVRLAGAGLAMLALMLGCTGCIPLKFNTSPGATGRVVDASTHAPISGAELAISRSTYPPESPEKAFEDRRAPLVLSQQGGSFSIPPERRLDLYCLPVDVFPRFGLLVVRQKGYQTACVPFWSKSLANLGDIQLQAGAPAGKTNEVKQGQAPHR